VKPLDDASVSSDDTVQATPESPAAVAPSSDAGGAPVDLAALDIDTSGRYVLGATHATGGLGRVVRARDKRLHRTVAVKELLQRTPAAEARFVREALITARLEHPGIVPVHDAARRPGGEPFYSMKLVSGRTLKDLIEERRTLAERLALVPNILAVAEAIAYAHSKDVIHRDLKPANVIVGEFGETVVIDWGLAKDLAGQVAEPEPAVVDPVGATIDSGASRPGASGPGVTAAGNIMGTPSYMAPEQARGAEVDARADVYALGAMLYEVLTGDAPYVGKSSDEILARAIIGEPAPVLTREPDVPPDLVAIVTKAMARDAAGRYPDAAPLADDLRRFQTGQLVTARHYSAGTLLRRWIARHRAIVAVTAAAAVALAATGVVSFRRIVAQRNVAERERAAAQTARGAAEAARSDAEARSLELVYRRAETELGRDPTAALAILKSYPPDGPRAELLGGLIDEAIAAGVARHVLPTSDWVLSVGWTADGRVVAHCEKGGVWVWNAASGEGGQVGTLPPALVSESRGISPDGRLVAIGDAAGAIHVLSTADGTVRELPGHATFPEVEFSEVSGALVSASRVDDSLRVWDANRGALVREVGLSSVTTAAISSDGTVLGVGTATGQVLVVPVATGTVRVIARLPGVVGKLRLSRDGAIAVAQVVDGRVFLLVGSAVRPLGAMALLKWIAFAHNGDRVALGTRRGDVTLVTIAGGAVRTLGGHTDAIYNLEFTRDDRVLVSASDDGTARVWELDTGAERVLRGHRDDVTFAAISPDGTQLATSSLDSTVRIWPLAAAREQVFPTGVRDPSGTGFSRDGTMGAVANRAGELARVDIARRSTTHFLLSPWTTSHPPSLGRDYLAMARGERPLLWELATATERLLPPRHAAPISAVALTPDDRVLFTADERGLELVWDVAAGTAVELPVANVVTAARFLPDGKRIALSGFAWMELWDVERRERLLDAGLLKAGHLQQIVRELRVSQDGSIVSSFAQKFLLWNLASNTLREVPRPAGVETASISPDGQLVAMPTLRRQILLWSAATGKTDLLGAHNDIIYSVVFSPDGGSLASVSYDRTARLWNLATRRFRVLRGHTSAVTAAGFSLDGARLMTVDSLGIARIWPLATLPDDSPAAVPARLTTATTATIDPTGLATTPTPTPTPNPLPPHP
jgi:WD40 repeat protein/tRNA A-37 threonylcarbamoyl transferase component Bud32